MLHFKIVLNIFFASILLHGCKHHEVDTSKTGNGKTVISNIFDNSVFDSNDSTKSDLSIKLSNISAEMYHLSINLDAENNLKQKLIEQSLKTLDLAIQADSMNMKAYLRYSQILTIAKVDFQTTAYIDKLIEKDSLNPGYLTLKGMIVEKLGNPDLADLYYNQSLNLYKGQKCNSMEEIEGNIYRQMLPLLLLGRKDELLQLIESFVKKYPQKKDSYETVIKVYSSPFDRNKFFGFFP